MTRQSLTPIVLRPSASALLLVAFRASAAARAARRGARRAVLRHIHAPRELRLCRRLQV